MEFKKTERRAYNGEWLLTGDSMLEKMREMEERQ